MNDSFHRWSSYVDEKNFVARMDDAMSVHAMTIGICVIAVGYYLEEKNKWLGHVLGVLMIILIGILLGNLGAVSSSESTYEPVFRWAVPMGIALMLMAFNPKDVLKVRSEYLLCFAVGAGASMLGGLIAGLLFRSFIQGHAWQVAGQLTASYVGGYENAVAVGTSLNIPKDIFLTAFAGDSVLTALWMIANIIHGKLIRSAKCESQEKPSFIQGMAASFDISTLAIIIAVAVAIVFVSAVLHREFNTVPQVIWLSMLATGITFLPWRCRFQGSYIVGSFILSLFFFACGAISDISTLFNSGTLLILFPAVIVGVHACVLFTVARIINIDRKVVLVTSQALIGGPATALAVVQAVRWNNRYEAIVLGLLGYAVANYAGYLVAWSLVNI